MTNTKYVSPFFSSVKFFCIIGILSCSIFSHAQNWNEVIKRGASNRQVEDWFGYDVAISDDYAIVGAHYEDEDANGLGKIQSIKLYDSQGKLVENTQTTNSSLVHLEWTTTNGMLWVVVTTNKGTYRTKVVSIH